MSISLTGANVRRPACRNVAALVTAAAAFLAFSLLAPVPARAQSQTGSRDLVISQVYTRGGEAGATFQNDFVEIFNRGNVTVNLSDYTLQVLVNAPPAPGFPGGLVPVGIRVVSSNGFVGLNPGKYFLYQFAGGGGGGAPLPAPDAGGGFFPSGFDLPAATGRVALVKGSPTHPYAQYGCSVGVDAALADFFAYGPATCVEGGANFPAPSPTTAALRNADGCADADNNAADFSTAAPAPRNSATAQRLCPSPSSTSSLQFALSAASVGEGAGFAEILVTRAGSVGPTSVQYATTDETATERSDYTTALGTLEFAAGEASKSFRVLITDDARPEGGESLTVSLNHPTNGVTLDTRHIMRLSITDDDAAAGANPVEATDFFVRQHYFDFLARTPDTPGFQFWTAQVEGCGTDAQCREVRRVNVSAAFFLSIEFQQTGYFAYRAFKASFPDSESRPRGFPLYRELWRDARQLGRNVVVLQPGWEQQLEANRQAYAADFVTRPEFLLTHPASQTPAQFVDSLNAASGNSLSPSERDQQVAALTAAGNGPAGRASVLTRVAEDEDFKRAELNRAFVLMQYFGYLRRNPDDAPEPNRDFEGYDFWFSKLVEFNGDYVRAEMVKAFISSDEYRARFLTP
ncbi:MAG TPA: Calx-beta domain-containing protein [Pyrinomonadaceae bacterium]|jgi:hypothetical protein